MESGEAMSDGAGQEHLLRCSSMQRSLSMRSSRTIIQVCFGTQLPLPAAPRGIKKGQKHQTLLLTGKHNPGDLQSLRVLLAASRGRCWGGSRLCRSEGVGHPCTDTGGVTLPWHRLGGVTVTPRQMGHDGTALLRPGLPR